jgi:hypothetical protein
LSVRTYGPAAAAKPAAQRLVKHPQVATVAALFSLGSITLRRLGKQLGDTVKVAGEGWWQASRMEIVGRAVLNEAGFDGSFTSGTGGLVHPDRLRRLAGDDPEAFSPGTYPIRVNPGVDRNQAIARLQRDVPGATRPRPHADIRNLQRVADLPNLPAALVALFALGAVTHALALPLGVAAGRWAWQLTTLQLGVDSAPSFHFCP